MNTPNFINAIRGPVICTAELPRQLALFESVVGMHRVADEHLDETATEQWFGVTGLEARAMLLETPGTQIGVWLVEFTPPSDVVIRVGGVGVATDALKMVDVFTADRLTAVARLKAHGFELVSEGASVDLPDGSRFVEAHVRAPDGVMFAVIEPLNLPAARFVTCHDRVFSEVQSSSGPVSDFEPVRRFYEEVLGIPMGLAYEFESESFSKMVGTPHTIHIRANNYGRVVEDVMMGIIHYGLPAGTYESLRERARPPHRGLVGVRLEVTGLAALLDRCRDADVEIVRPITTLRTAAFSNANVAVVRAPHGVWHWLIERD
jgi:catechol 2,3-dioxygenase-like lactoylglutathione lyase family enzyme